MKVFLIVIIALLLGGLVVQERRNIDNIYQAYQSGMYVGSENYRTAVCRNIKTDFPLYDIDNYYDSLRDNEAGLIQWVKPHYKKALHK